MTTATLLVPPANLKGDYPGAENAARESVQVFSRALTTPKDNAYFANPLMELGLILNKTGRSREAEAHLGEALEIRTRLLPGGNPLIGFRKEPWASAWPRRNAMPKQSLSCSEATPR